ncbi:MAG TPA: sigma 54-interacting transcriptional regulator [Kofleriaceae bacterium]|nr:sigma 54-interacting transcriptional regulator [Kofleriaceae bacterium]
MSRDRETHTTSVTATESVAPGRSCLFVVAGGTPGWHRLPETGSLVVGRSTGADLVLPDHGVSRRHAIIHCGVAPMIEDLGSANGTVVCGRRLAPGERRPLIDGDVVQLARATLIVQSMLDDARDAHSLRASAQRQLASEGGDLMLTEASMRAVRQLAERVAGSMLSVLIVGETGVGKELVAELVHRRSPRAPAPLLCLNCAALSEPLIESELFGHEKGAFTGALRTKPGLLEVARGGTVFLDEIGELPLVLQAKLLRVVESRQILRVGGLEPRAIDVRFVAATHRDLQAEVHAGRFREDLFYRLNGITLAIPPLRERTSEIAELARRFVDEACARTHRRPAPSWSANALALLVRHPWPGNIRELKNAVERAVVLCTGDVLEVAHLPEALRDASLSDPLGPRPPIGPTDDEAALRSRLADLDRRRIAEALAQAGGNQSRAARALGIARNTLIARMKAYGLDARRNP